MDFFSEMASSGSPLLRHLFNSLVKRVAEVSREVEDFEVSREVEDFEVNRVAEDFNDCPRDRSYSVTSTDSGYCEGSSLQGKKCF